MLWQLQLPLRLPNHHCLKGTSSCLRDDALLYRGSFCSNGLNSFGPASKSRSLSSSELISARMQFRKSTMCLTLQVFVPRNSKIMSTNWSNGISFDTTPC